MMILIDHLERVSKLNEFQRFIKEQMEARGLSQNEFANKVGINSSTITSWMEVANPNPSMATLQKIARFTKVNLYTVAALAYPELTHDNGLSNAALRFAALFEQLPSESKQLIEAVIAAYIKQIWSD